MAFAPDEALERLKILHRDLVDLSESQLPNIERLQVELESRIDDFRKLLDKASKNDKSRQQLLSGKVTVDDEQYEINDNFKQDALQLADLLNLDELDAAKLYFRALDDSLSLDRNPLGTSVILFHDQRQYLLECLRLCLYTADDSGLDNEDLQIIFQTLRNIVLHNQDVTPNGPSAYWKKCIEGLKNIEVWTQQLNERIQSASMTGQSQSDDFAELVRFQLTSLNQQHQALGAILYYIVRAGYMKVDDFRALLNQVRSFDRYDVFLVHYLPALSAAICFVNSPEGQCSAAEGQSLNQLIVSIRDNDAWSLRSFQAAATTLWIAEYCGRFSDHGDNLNAFGGGPDDSTAKSLPQKFTAALQDGAFQFILTVSQDVQNSPWLDPLRHSLLDLLLQEAPVPRTDRLLVDSYFKEIFMKQIQSFAESCVTNLPDTLRGLKSEEDELRRQMHSRIQLQSNEYEYHLERFLLIVAFAYEGFEDAAESFWSEPDGNMYGFLQWSSQRQSTPHVAAFCEMLRALAEGEAGATHAHKFLLEDAPLASGRVRRSSPLSWAHIIREIEFYSQAIRDRPAPQQQDKAQADQYVEPESAAMLELYLRLLSHLCRRSTEVRLWFLTHQSFHIHEHLLLLCGSAIESRLRACCFNALASLLQGKSREVGDGIWAALDAWVSGNFPVSSVIHRPQISAASAERFVFDLVSTGFDEPVAFVALLEALVSPFPDESGLNDTLPFPESLGAAYRMPGMEPYTDFVLGRVFAVKSLEIHDPAQLHLLRYQCLRFVSTCLSTFNEDFVVFANQSSISVDSAMRTSSLAAYARMHPFARVMEWLFNDGVVSALFLAAKQSIVEVNSALSDSPFIIGLGLSVQVIDLAMSMQSTYLDIVRPIIKTQSSNRQPIVSNSALASFEDAILNNLDIVPYLGLYCGSGHQDLVIHSLRLLQRLASSRKLAAPLTSGNGRFLEKSRLITALERNNDVEAIARLLILQMQFDEGELDQGPLSPAYTTKLELFRFLNSCLAASPDRPTVAHSLLGFTCLSDSLDVANDGLWAKGSSLFHALLRYIMTLPFGDPGDLSSWLVTIKEEALAVIMKLLQSPLSAQIILLELRTNDFLVAQWAAQPVVSRDTLWDGRSLDAAEFFLSDSSSGLAGLLGQRSAIFDYAAMEMRSSCSSGLTTLRNRLKSTILGSASFADGELIECQTLFEMIDCVDAEIGDILPLPQTKLFNSNDLEICRTGTYASPAHDVIVGEQLLALRYQEMRANGQLSNPNEEQQMQADAANVSACLRINNRRMEVAAAHITAMKSWTQVITVMLDGCEFEEKEKDSFIVRSLQTILPLLEQSFSNNTDISTTLAQLCRTLLRAKVSASSASSTTIEAIDECFFQLFRIALAGIQNSTTTARLREIWGQICHEYIRGLLNRPGHAQQRSNALQSIKVRGSGFFEVLCDEAFSGEGSCRTSALLLLGSMTTLSTRQGSKYVLDAFNKINYIQVLVENIKNISSELQSEPSSAQVLSYYNASLSLLLRICQTRLGASHVVNAGIFYSIRASGLFNADPDIGLELENPSALGYYFALLLSVVRIINAAVIARGSQNDQTIAQARQFLDEYRSTISAIFKRSARIGLGGATVGEVNQRVLEELADALTVLMVSSGFLDSEERGDELKQMPLLFA